MGLSNAERQRRYIERLKAKAAATTEPQPSDEIAALKAEIARLKARQAEPRQVDTPVTVEAVRDLAKRYGYSLRKRGAEYHLVNGALIMGFGSLEDIVEHFDWVEAERKGMAR
jgi:hypothetical protein